MARGGMQTMQDKQVADDRTKGRGWRTQHKAAGEAVLLGRRFALHGGGHLGCHQVLRRRGDGTWSGSYVVVMNRRQLGAKE